MFPITDTTEPFSLTRAQLLAAKQTGKQQWEINTGGMSNSIRLLPYIMIDEERYSTYLHVT
jgi:hypothetical protein